MLGHLPSERKVIDLIPVGRLSDAQGMLNTTASILLPGQGLISSSLLHESLLRCA